MLPRLGTFSIVARCARTGELGVAICTKFLAVGSLAPNAKAGVGACSSQAFVNPYHRYWVLDELAKGKTAEEALEASLARDPRAALRQVIVVDRDGRSAAHSGACCDTWFGHITGPNFAAAGNMLAGPEVVAEMANAFLNSSTERPLAERLLESLEAGQKAGGDKRGKQPAALLVVHEEDYPRIDLRVDDHPEPIAELRRLYQIYQEEYAVILEGLPTKKNLEGRIGEEFWENCAQRS